MLLLSVESENGSVLTYRLQKTQITVGSSSKNDVVLRLPGVGERHLVIHRNGGTFTFVTVDRQTVVLNGERRSRGVLNPGDRIRIGPSTLVFQGSEGGGVELTPAGEVPRVSAPQPAPRASGDTLAFQSDPAGFTAARARIFELFLDPGTDLLHRLVHILREALPSTEVGIFVAGDGERPVVLASSWSGPLPRVRSGVVKELSTLGRYAVVSGAGGDTALLAVLGPRYEVNALLAARPMGSLGSEGVALLAEVTRLLGLQWSEVEREDSVFTGWELEARHRLESLLPGSSQAMQVLRSGILASAHGDDPVLICGASGVGRTEVARILATLGPVGGRPLAVFEGRDADAAVLRQELFGPSGHPTLGPEGQGALARARGGVFVVRQVDLLPGSLQSELAALISSEQREPLSASSIRWIVTCGEDPLALVQQGKLSSNLFMLFSRRLLRVPRLTERREDLPLLIAALLRRSAEEQHKVFRGITLECLNGLLARQYPGEMAELVGEINRLTTATEDGEMVRCSGFDLAASEDVSSSSVPRELAEVLESDNLKEIIPRVEQTIIDRVMRQVKGNQSKGARVLAISRGALIAKLKEYGVPDYRYLRRRRGGA
jgi:DNA-binding NtrC family response regulator